MADISPPGCTGNKANFDVDRTPAGVFRLGDPITFIITGDNTKNQGCDIALTGPLNFALPNSRGVPAGASTQILASGTTFHFGDTLATRNIPWVVAADPDVTVAQVELAGNADLQDVAAPNHDFFKIDRTISIVITHPSMAITKVANPVAGVAPLTVTYTYQLTNTGDANIGNINVSDAGDGACSPLVYASGDLNADSVLGAVVKNGAGVITTPAETWTYTCQRVFPVAGVFPNVVTATGTSTVDKRPVAPVQANASVTVTAPPAPPQAAVKPAAAVQEACTLATSKTLSVRAKELTTIKVTAKNVPAGTKVTVTLPGGKKVTAKTNSKGVALLHVRPPKSGTATIKAAECSDVEKLTVKAARKTVSRRVPQVTG